MGLLDRFRRPQGNEGTIAGEPQPGKPGLWHVRVPHDPANSAPIHSEQTEFRGPAIRHAYRMAKGFQSERCPRCQGGLKQKYVRLIYLASRGQFRQNVSPCAYLCEGCSVAVIDESLPQLAELADRQNFEYVFPLAVVAEKEVPPPSQIHEFALKSYEGHEPAYVLNEDEEIENVAYEDEMGDLHQNGDDDDYLCPHCVAEYEQLFAAGWSGPAMKSNERQKQRNKRKQQKASRRANRRRH